MKETIITTIDLKESIFILVKNIRYGIIICSANNHLAYIIVSQINRIADNGLQDEVLLHDRFIPDDDVKYYFSAADFVVQPYKTATQSGVTQIAYQFCVPMVVTKVGGLAEIVPDGRVGYVCEPTPEGVAGAIERMYEGDTLQRFRENCVEERRRFSWEEMCSRITELYGLVASGK